MSIKTFTAKLGNIEITYRHTCEVQVVAYRPPKKGESFLHRGGIYSAGYDRSYPHIIVREELEEEAEKLLIELRDYVSGGKVKE